MLKPETARWLGGALRSGTLSRYGLARELCELEDWRNPKGKLCVSSAAKGLPGLAKQLHLKLPAPRERPGQGGPPRTVPVPDTRCRGPLSRLGKIALRRVRSAKDRALWGAMLDRHHPRQRARAPGCRLTYLLESSRFGLLGGFSFVAAPMRLGPLDQWLQWSPRARGAHISEVVNNDRFLLLGGVRVRNLASHALKLVCDRLPEDWQQHSGTRPLLLETCVDSSKKGSCYRAAGWQHLGATQGRPPGSQAPVSPKDVWVRPLVGEPRAQRARGRRSRPPPPELVERLCAEPERELGSWPELDLPEDAGYAEREFARSDLPDGRLRRRLMDLGQAWECCPGQAVSVLIPKPAAQKAAYRFLHNPRVQPSDILQPHREALVDRSRLYSTVLLVQDTTSLNYTGMGRSTQGLGPLREKANSARGLFVHALLTFSGGGRPLGVNGLESWARPEDEPEDEQELESARWLRGFEEGVRLGRACEQTRVIVVGDRESDMWSLFEAQARHSDQAGLLVRASRGSQRRVHDRKSDCLRPLFDHMDFLPTLVRGRKVQVDSRGGKHPRGRHTVVTDIQAGRVELLPPKDRPEAENRKVLAVRVLQTNEQEGQWPLEWVLLCSEGEATAEWAKRIVRWYERRWGIEEWFRVLKTGMRIEDRQLRTADSVKCCLAFDAINAWRVFELQRCAREEPHEAARKILTLLEMHVIWTAIVGRDLLPPGERGRPPPEDIRSWVVLLGRTVGWQPRKRRRLPGNQVLWKAWKLVQQGVLVKEAEQAVARRLGLEMPGPPDWALVGVA